MINKNYAISKVVNTIPKLKYFSHMNNDNDNIPAGDAFWLRVASLWIIEAITLLSKRLIGWCWCRCWFKFPAKFPVFGGKFETLVWGSIESGLLGVIFGVNGGLFELGKLTYDQSPDLRMTSWPRKGCWVALTWLPEKKIMYLVLLWNDFGTQTF